MVATLLSENGGKLLDKEGELIDLNESPLGMNVRGAAPLPLCPAPPATCPAACLLGAPLDASGRGPSRPCAADAEAKAWADAPPAACALQVRIFGEFDPDWEVDPSQLIMQEKLGACRLPVWGCIRRSHGAPLRCS
jgi:hypothetical protein